MVINCGPSNLDGVTPKAGPISLTDGSIMRGLVKLTLPILYANMLQSLNGSVNSMWVGHYIGGAALAASSNANTVMIFLTSLALGIVAAATIHVGQRIGARELSEAKRALATSLIFLTAVSIAIAVAGLLLSEPLLRAMKTPNRSLPMAVSYMCIIFLALPYFYVSALITSLLTGTGDSRTPFYFMLLTVALDIGLNPLFIFGAGPIPRLGIAGSALATTVAVAVALAVLVGYLYRTRHFLCLHREDLGRHVIHWPTVGALVSKGSSIGAQSIVLSSSSLLLYSLVNRFGVDAAAAYGASILLWSYVQMPALAVSTAASVMASHNFGAQRWNRVDSIARIGVVVNILLTSLIVMTIQLLERQAYSLFLPPGSPALEIAGHLIRISIWSCVFVAGLWVLFGVMAACGEVFAPLCISTTVFLVVQIPAAKALLDRWHADAIWWSLPISSALGLAVALSYYKYGRWRSAKHLPEPALHSD